MDRRCPATCHFGQGATSCTDLYSVKDETVFFHAVTAWFFFLFVLQLIQVYHVYIMCTEKPKRKEFV